jgi:hypothetical protein
VVSAPRGLDSGEENEERGKQGRATDRATVGRAGQVAHTRFGVQVREVIGRVEEGLQVAGFLGRGPCHCQRARELAPPARGGVWWTPWHGPCPKKQKYFR